MEIPVFKDPENVWFLWSLPTTIFGVKAADCQGEKYELVYSSGKKRKQFNFTSTLLILLQLCRHYYIGKITFSRISKKS